MKELEEVNCEIRRVIDIQSLVSSRLKNLDDNEYASQGKSQLLDCSYNPQGGFLNDVKYAWLSNGPYLVVLNVKTGENISSWTFCEKISCVTQFPTQPGQLPLLLVGLDNEANKVKDSIGLLCVFDCTTSRVLRAIRMPAGVEQVCIVSGGAEWEEFNEKRPDNILSKTDGIACVVLCNLYHVMVDLQRSQWETSNLYPIMDEASPAEIDFSMALLPRSRNKLNETKHVAYNLLNDRIEQRLQFSREEFEMSTLYEEKLTSAVITSTKIGCLISGCLGRIIIWQNDGSVRWISPLVDGSMAVTHLALLEPTDDPRPYCYLWVVYQDETLKMAPLLRMYALLFERKYCDKGTNLYFNLEIEPSLKFEFELEAGDKIINLSSIERESNPDQTDSINKRGEDNLLLITSNDRTLLFDLNQWYKEQMPRTINDCQNPNSIMASYRTRSHASQTKNTTISSSYVPFSLQEFPNNSPNSSEELFYPNSLSLEWVELSSNQLTFWSTRGIQAEVLREMAIAGPIILIDPSETFHKCFSVGLIPFNTEVSFESDQNAQRDMLLSLCLEQRWASFLVKCVREWSDGSVSYLYPMFLKWGVQRAASIKMIADRLCIPLFDQSGSNISEAEVRTLRFCSQQLECLSNVVAKLPIESTDLIKQQRALKRISTYLQVLLWFYDVGMLPETQEIDEGALPISLTLKIPYPVEKLTMIYKEKREQLKTLKIGNDDKEEGLFIDEMITRECSVLRSQWEKESGDISTKGYYPPPSLQSLLRSYLTDCDQTEICEMEYKHQITIYLLMDLAMLLQGSYPSVDQLIKYPSAFKMSPSLIKLTQAFWLLDHEDYQGFLEMMTGQLVSDSDVKDWHHRLVLRTLVRNNQHKLALVYLRIRKPPLSSIEDQSTVINLSVEYGLVQSAFHRRPPSHYSQLLISFFQACKMYGKLSEILHLTLDAEEEEIFVKFLENEDFGDMRLLYYLQRCRYTEANNGNPLGLHRNISKNTQPPALAMLNACNATLPEVMKRFALNSNKSNLDADLDSRYPRPMSHRKSCKKSVGIYESVMRKAKETYLRGEKLQIPFVTAPCTSLKLSNNHTNTNCVLFPALTHKSRGKRTSDQMQEDEDVSLGVPDTSKRRKLSDVNETINKSGVMGLGLNAVLETPLIKRKNNVTLGKDTPSETPHSILKIRQMISNSSSPNVTLSASENMKTPSYERDRKISRQIRFTVDQGSKNTSREEGVDEEEESNGKSTSVSKSASEESEDVFFSPNVSNKSCGESAVLTDSSLSCKDAYHPRPRPSLRRSYVGELKETLNESGDSSKRATIESSSTNTSTTTSLNEHESNSLSSLEVDRHTSSTTSSKTLKHSSVPSGSIHSSTVPSSDTSFETHVPPKRVGISPRSRFCKDQSFTLEKGRSTDNNHTSSSGSFERNTLNNGEMAMDIDYVQTKVSRPSFELSKLEKTKKSSPVNTQESLELDRMMRGKRFSESRSEKESHTPRRSLENYLSGRRNNEEEERSKMQSNIYEKMETQKDENLVKNITQTRESRAMQEELSEDENTEDKNVEENKLDDAISSDEYEHELCLSSDEDDEMEDEAFRSFSNSVEGNYDNASTVPSSRISESDKKNLKLYETRPASEILTIDMSEITDDESVEDERQLTLRYDEFESLNYPPADHNITDDESNSSIIINKEVQRNESKDLTSVKTPGRSDSVDKEILEQNIMGTPVEKSMQTPVRETRSRRASSIAKDTGLPADVASENVKTGRSRRASSLAKDVASAKTGGKNVGEEISASTRFLETRRSASVTSELPKDEAEDKVETTVRRSSRRVASVQRESIEPAKTLSRKERASSVSSVISEDDNAPTVRKTNRGRRSSSLAKEDIGVSPAETTTTDMNVTEGRSVRKRANSVPKEIVKSPGRMRRSNSVINDVIPEESPVETKRGKRTSKFLEESKKIAEKVIPEETSDLTVPLTRGRKASKLAGETSKILEETVVEEPVKSKRGKKSSQPMEEVVPEEPSESTTKARRGRKAMDRSVKETSVVVENVPKEVMESSVTLRRGRRTTASKTIENLSSKPTTNTRSRRSSIQSVPEDLEEILSVPSTKRDAKESKHNTRRIRRATSVDLPVTEVTKRTRSVRAGSIAKDPIAEEPSEIELSKTLNEKRSTRRKPANANTTIQESTTSKTKRKRVSSTTSVERDEQFLFSQPTKAEDLPVDNEALNEVPKYVFSPPQTRSRNVTTDQHRRNIKPFIPIPRDEVKEKTDVQRNLKSSQSTGYTSVTVNRVESHFMTKFVIPKSKSKSTCD